MKYRNRPVNLFIGLFILLSTGCYRWEPVETYETYQWQGDPWMVRVTEASGQAWLLDHFELRADTLRGAGYDFDVARDPRKRAVTPVVVAMDEVIAIDEKKRRMKQELMIYGGILLISSLTFVIAF